nr:MAG TPA: hypothetical protein [Caudoviricetes sp.]
MQCLIIHQHTMNSCLPHSILRHSSLRYQNLTSD